MTIIIRKNPKQSWSQGQELTLLDSPVRQAAWVEALNETVGWKQYQMAEAN